MHDPFQLLVMPLMMLLIVVGLVSLLGWAVTYKRRAERSVKTNETVEMTCTICRRQLVFTRNALERLTPTEMGLAVSSKPEAVGRPLAHYSCPYCDAAHIFAVDRRQVEWLGTNLYQPQALVAHCFQCRQPLKVLPGHTGGYAEQTSDTARLDLDVGLKCPRCGAVCCVRCCRSASYGRTTDGSLICPRCSRRPIDLLYYP